MLNSIIHCYAESANFYEAEYIDNIYMSKYQYSTKTIYYQKARFFRKTGSNEFAYCIEPFIFFNDSAQYNSTLNPNNLTNEQIDRITKIAHFGYGYQNHSDVKWYAITQMMIWQTADPNSGDYYFTDSLNGNRISPYDNEINEINYLINVYNTYPSFTNNTFNLVANQQLTITDTNNVINSYTSNNQEVTINNNQISIKAPLKEGNYEYNFSKQDSYYNKPYIFYQANNSQNLIETGNLPTINIKIKVNVKQTFIQLTKLDKDTNSITPSGSGILDGAIYKLYDEKNNEVTTLTIKDNQAQIKNLLYGKYFLKENTPGQGYTLDKATYEIDITPTNNKIDINLQNKIIDKKITIIKKYGETNSLQNEVNIQFDIYNVNNEYIQTITTNEFGQAEIILPYGEYIFIQKNTTSGYQKQEPFNIVVDNQEDEIIELKDLKIPVPNTHLENSIIPYNNYSFIITLFIIYLIYVKKKKSFNNN